MALVLKFTRREVPPSPYHILAVIWQCLETFGSKNCRRGRYVRKRALDEKSDPRFSPSATNAPFRCIILYQLQGKTETCPVIFIIAPSTLPSARVPGCSLKAFCFAAMLPSNHFICPFINLAAFVEVTHILLKLLPIGTLQKEVTVNRFLMTSGKGLDPNSSLQAWRNV